MYVNTITRTTFFLLLFLFHTITTVSVRVKIIFFNIPVSSYVIRFHMNTVKLYYFSLSFLPNLYMFMFITLLPFSPVSAVLSSFIQWWAFSGDSRYVRTGRQCTYQFLYLVLATQWLFQFHLVTGNADSSAPLYIKKTFKSPPVR